MKRNRIFALLLAVLMVMSLAACSAKEEKVEFSRGVIDGNVYKSEFAGITFTAPDGFTFYSDEDIAAVTGSTSDILGEDYSDTVISDMFCEGETGATFNINYENLNGLYGELLDEESYIELSRSQLESTFEGVDSISLASFENTELEIAGTKLHCANVILDLGGINVYETLVVKEAHGYMAICTASSADQAEIDYILSGLRVAE